MGTRFLLAGRGAADRASWCSAGAPAFRMTRSPAGHRGGLRALPPRGRQRAGRGRRAGRRLRAGGAAHRRDAALGGRCSGRCSATGPSAATVAGLLLGLVGVAVLLLPGVQGAAPRSGRCCWSACPRCSGPCGTVLATRRPMPADPFVTTVVEMAAGGTAMVVLGLPRRRVGAAGPGRRRAVVLDRLRLPRRWSAASSATAPTSGCSPGRRCRWSPPTRT